MNCVETASLVWPCGRVRVAVCQLSGGVWWFWPAAKKVIARMTDSIDTARSRPKSKSHRRPQTHSSKSTSASVDGFLLETSGYTMKGTERPRRRAKTTRSKSNVETCRLSPWYSSQEFDFVGRGLTIATQLFSSSHLHQPRDPPDSLNTLHQALQRVYVWQHRWDRIPHSIEISASLAQVLLLDFTQQHVGPDTDILSSPIPSSSISFSMVLRFAYATSIVRAVNGIADSMQKQRSVSCYNNNTHTNKPSHSLSIAHLCSMLGLPSWIVHVRHDATHKELPSLMVLRLAAQTLLTFMMEEYFSQPQRQSLWVQQEAMSWLESYEHLCNKQTLQSVGEEESKVAEEGELAKHKIESKVQFYNESLLVQELEPEQIQKQDRPGNSDSIAECEREEIEMQLQEKEHESMITLETTDATKPLLLSNREKKQKKRLEKQERAHAMQEKIRLYGSFGILAESSSSPSSSLKKDKIRKRTHSSISYSSTEKPLAVTTTKQPKKKIIKRTDHQAALLACSKQFVSHTPMDVAKDVALSFFIWGTDNKHPMDGSSLCGGVLLSNQTESSGDETRDHDASDYEFEEGKKKYTILLRTIIASWPGFLHAFLVHLAEYFLRMQNNEASIQLLGSPLEQEVSTDSQENQNRINTEKRVYAWIQYILSREFHCVFETSISVFKRVNLNKKDITKWTNEERCFMASPLPVRSLVRFHLPLTSLCQRIQVYTEKSTVARKLLSLFQDILDTSSSVKTQSVDNLKHLVEPLAENVQCKSDENTQMDDVAVCAPIFRKKDSSDTDITKNVSESLMSEIETSTHRVSWTLCETWEPCSIGTLPGYIS